MRRSRGSDFASSVLEWVAVFAVAFGCAYLIQSFVVQAYAVPTGSMEDTIEIGDRIFAQKVTRELGMSVRAGEIVVFSNPDSTSDHDILVKRVIATAGQTVDMCDGKLVIDDVVQDEPYVKGATYQLATQAPGVSVSYPYTVPEGEVWVMGDNRENSADSRYFGSVPESSIQAVAVLRYWPLDRAGAVS